MFPIGMAPSFQAPNAAISVSISVPDNRFPKSRRASVSGFEISSTRLMKTLNGSRYMGNGWVA